VNGARWVVYRELRDFFSLHTHYAVTNVLYGTGGNTKSERTAGEGSGRDKLPDFPTTSIPYLKFLNEKSGSKIGKAEFARLQREQMENYLVDLIRVVVSAHSFNVFCLTYHLVLRCSIHLQIGFHRS
jgi:phospholipase D1/2